jgi:hypothetical protein
MNSLSEAQTNPLAPLQLLFRKNSMKQQIVKAVRKSIA